MKTRFLPFLSLILAALATPPAAFAQSYVNFEGKQTSPVRLSPDGTRLFAVNTPDNRLSVFDATRPLNSVLVAEIPVEPRPSLRITRNGSQSVVAWPTNRAG